MPVWCLFVLLWVDSEILVVAASFDEKIMKIQGFKEKCKPMTKAGGLLLTPNSSAKTCHQPRDSNWSLSLESPFFLLGHSQLMKLK